MAEFKKTVSIEAKDEQDASRKLKAACVVISQLTTRQIEKLADIAKNDPATLELAKQFLGV